MKRFVSIMVVASLPFASMAQSNYSFDEEVNSELEKMSAQAKPQATASGTTASPQVQINVQSAPQASASNTTRQETATIAAAPVSQTQTAPVVQPTTVIESTPLTESKAEALRKSRQDAEVATEQKIVEKLEASRLEDEKRRANELFGQKKEEVKAEAKAEVVVVPAATPAPVVAPAPVVVVAPVATPAPEVAPVVVAPVAAPVNASVMEVQEEAKQEESKTYVSGILGTGNYPDVQNVKGKYAVGVAFGSKSDDRFAFEGSFMFSQYDVEQRFGGGVFPGPYGVEYYPRITQMNTYQGSIAGKYSIMNGTFRPVVGAVGTYSYRTFRDTQFGNPSYQAQSNAIDLGLIAGFDVAVSKKFSVGLDYRYMMNLTSWASDSTLQRSFARSVYGSDTPIEQLNYQQISIIGTTTF